MKNKGFTLIELLAVIVILAIIALIATPIVLNIIDDTKESSAKESVNLYARAIQQSVARYQLNNPGASVLSGTFTASNGGKTLTSNGKTLQVEYTGENIICNSIQISKEGTVKLNECTVNGNGNYSYGYENETEVYTCSLTTETFNAGSHYYTDYMNIVTIEVVKCGTEEFYVLEKNNSTITMLAKHNLRLDSAPYLQSHVYQGETTFYYPETSVETEGYTPEAKVYSYVNTYGEHLKSIIGDNSISARLLTTLDLNNYFGCDSSCNFKFPVEAPGFWTTSIDNHGNISVIYPYFGVTIDIWAISSANESGVRPVITISASKIA